VYSAIWAIWLPTQTDSTEGWSDDPAGAGDGDKVTCKTGFHARVKMVTALTVTVSSRAV
jgi:hypothetical protein